MTMIWPLIPMRCEVFYWLMKMSAHLASVGLALLIGWAFPALEAASPNIVLIISDDQSYRDFGFMGNDLVHTPHLDQLAAQSARYPNAYVPMSVCRPSLATLLTGLPNLASARLDWSWQ